VLGEMVSDDQEGRNVSGLEVISKHPSPPTTVQYNCVLNCF